MYASAATLVCLHNGIHVHSTQFTLQREPVGPYSAAVAPFCTG